MNRFLPQEYSPRNGHAHYLDIPGNLIYQPHVYALAAFLADRCSAKWVVDIGCGSAIKLKPFSGRFGLVCVDCAPALELARQSLPGAEFIEHDLETGLPALPVKLLERAVVICSDVVEHLQRPERLLQALANVAKIAPFVLISTPDRDRARGWLDNGPPANPTHVMEWSATEFVRFMRACGFNGIPIHGHTINTDFHMAKTTLLTVTGTHAVRPLPAADFRAAAVIHTYNEEDILPEVVEHLVSNGIEVHLFDNWSTDGTWKVIQSLQQSGKVVYAKRFPDVASNVYEWHSQLEKTAAYAATLDVDWVLHHDADEIRCSPWPGVPLRDALAHADRLGYSAVDFTVIDFRFLANRPPAEAPYQASLNHFEFGRRPGHFQQIKAWKNSRQKVVLADSGGHEAVFDGRRVFPLKFLLKHYPLRYSEQAAKKVFRDRLPRMASEQRSRGWHTQYNHLRGSAEVPGFYVKDLLAWHPVLFETEYLVERISGIGLTEIA
jgi:trans-aconitate methyltransferase